MDAALLGFVKIIPWWAYLFFLIIIVIKFLASKHRRNVLKSYIYLIIFRRIKNPKGQFYFLRYKVNPFLYEELILTSLKKAGHKIRRNKRYTGDGGIDGQCWIGGEHHLIQAKRYSNHIRSEDVKDFYNLCRRRNAQGLFVHTGRTGSKSWQSKGHVKIISGQRMLDLLSGKEIRLA